MVVNVNCDRAADDRDDDDNAFRAAPRRAASAFRCLNPSGPIFVAKGPIRLMDFRRPRIQAKDLSIYGESIYRWARCWIYPV